MICSHDHMQPIDQNGFAAGVYDACPYNILLYDSRPYDSRISQRLSHSHKGTATRPDVTLQSAFPPQ